MQLKAFSPPQSDLGKFSKQCHWPRRNPSMLQTTAIRGKSEDSQQIISRIEKVKEQGQGIIPKLS